VTSGSDSSDSARADRLIDRVADAAQALRHAEDQHRTTAAQLAEALLAAHQGGFTWSEVARAADLGSAETARIRAYRAKETEDLPPALRWRRERGSASRPTSSPPGVSVTDAAKKLGVSRKTVYARVRSGKLAATTDEAGRTRVLVEDD
jgi:excisionase family DNA binding protein